ncbi:MAG: ABC transporter substrate-binding protein [Syntrophomonadaceae bacterium]|nr:ABC transporter substrate-binding protein [Syntrophomonadaceae bacterium]
MAKTYNKALKYLALLLTLLFTIVILPGCQGRGGENLTTAPSNDTDAFITVKDCIGRQVKVPKNVERIACKYAYSGHVTVMLGCGSKIVAINNGLKRDVMLNKVCPGIGNCIMPFSSRYINIEELIKAEPDLVFIQLETAQNQAEVEKLDKFNIPYLVINFNNMEEQMNSIAVIGESLGKSERAREYNEYYQDCINLVQSAAANIPEQDRVRLYHSVNEATRTDSSDSLPADWIETTGAINVSVDKPLKLVEGDSYASLEQILLWDPDLIIANEPGVGQYILTNTQWAPLKAVKEKQVYQMPIGISRWGHPGGIETPLALLWTAKTVYPEKFADLDLKAEAKDYYQKFFNYSLTAEEMEQILSGESMRAPKNKK